MTENQAWAIIREIYRLDRDGKKYVNHGVLAAFLAVAPQLPDCLCVGLYPLGTGDKERAEIIGKVFIEIGTHCLAASEKAGTGRV